MPSLERAYGIRGAAIALGMATIAGGVQGVLAWQFDYVVIKVVIALAGALVLVMAGAISARRSLNKAMILGCMMAVSFFIARWIGWSLMQGGFPLTLELFTLSPLSWPEWMDAQGVSGFWILEATSMFVPALFGCYVGQERAAA